MVHIEKGELTQEEKALLEVIGKGMGAGRRRRSCQPGPGAWRSPGCGPAGTESARFSFGCGAGGGAGRWEGGALLGRWRRWQRSVR